MEKKAISAVWLSETDLTNLNSGIGGSNLVDIKRYKKNGVDYPYVSGQAMRHYLKESIMRITDKKTYCIPKDNGETCGNIKDCILCDLFGFMITIKGKGSVTRVSPVKMSPAMGLLSFKDNSTLDFLVRYKTDKSGKQSPDPVNIELGVNIYKAGLSIDLQRVADEEESCVKNQKTNGNKDGTDIKVNGIERVKTVLEAFKNLSDYSKQARLLTDFTPNFLLIGLQDKYNHLLQKALILRKNKNIDTDRLNEVLTMLKGETIYAGILSGTIDNEKEVKEILKNNKIETKTPTEAIDKIISELK
ncbi:MAG: type I-B CRISPR-associated protein Cas7/Cst2/DevR [Candidatus Aenigmarchaeota archaeon]|nr:type I-B CRISPR-associated protein Cas7/Cst2/DevR [Candidatus Aenigmarchaeota archaeon]